MAPNKIQRNLDFQQKKSGGGESDLEETFHRCLLDYLLVNEMIRSASTFRKESKYRGRFFGLLVSIMEKTSKRMEEGMKLPGRKAEAMVVDEETCLFHRCVLEYLVKVSMFRTAVAFRKEAKYKVGAIDIKDPAEFLWLAFTSAHSSMRPNAEAGARSKSASVKGKEVMGAETQNLSSQDPEFPATVKEVKSPDGLGKTHKSGSEHMDHSNTSPDWSRFRVSKPIPGPQGTGFCFKEIESETLVLACDFSSDGNWLAWSAVDGKIWTMKVPTLGYTYNGREQDSYVTDLRFRPTTSIFAASWSKDHTILIFDAANRTGASSEIIGDSDVVSLDFHPKQDLLFSCDRRGYVTAWDANTYSKTNFCEGASRKVRVQPKEGILLAGACQSVINVIDIPTRSTLCQLQAPGNVIRCVCWDKTGSYIATVTHDAARIWSSGGEFMYELHTVEDVFEYCAFHPGHDLLLVISSDGYLHLWNPSVCKAARKFRAHGDAIQALACSHENGKFASGCYGLKIWELQWV